MENDRGVRAPVLWIGAFAGWTAIGLFEAIPFYLDSIATGAGVTWWYALIRVLPRWYLWAGLTPAVVWLARRAPLERRVWRTLLGVYLPASVAFTALHIVAWLAIRSIFFPLPDVTILQLGVSYLVGFFALDMVAFWAILGGYYVFRYVDAQNERELERTRLNLRASRLEAQLAEMRLHAITAQLRPHFLFNTLNTIAGLVRLDPARAERMTIRLSELLRLVIDRTDALDVSLGDELKLVEAYVAIERVRYGDRLAVHMHVDPDVMDARIPSLGIQPLVENAIRHGIATVSRGGTVEVHARRCGDALRIEIRDDGAGLRPGPIHEGVGLGNTRARLQQFFGAAGRLEVAAGMPHGTIVTMELPYATSSPHRR